MGATRYRFVPEERSTKMKTSLLIASLLFSSSAVLFGQQVEVIQRALPSGYCPQEIVTGPDNALWFTSCNGIGRSTTQGVVTVYPIPTTNGSPQGITNGPDGALWFTERLGNNIGRITTAGVVTEYPIPSPDSNPWGITAGPDGALWFTEQNTLQTQIGRITTSGSFTLYPVPTADADPEGITTGHDGALWFTELGASQIGMATTSGVVTEFPAPAFCEPAGIAAGSDGALWFTCSNEPLVGRITTSGTLSQYEIPSGGFSQWITAGPEQLLWFTDGNVATITTTGVITEYPAPFSGSNGITIGPAGNPWYTGTSLIGEVVYPSATLSFTPNAGAAGAQVTLNGAGYKPNEVVKLYADKSALSLIGTADADSSGAFALAQTVGSLPGNVYYAVMGVGQTSGKVGVAPLTIQDEVAISPNSGAAGSSATVSGYGFYPGGEIKVRWSDDSILGTTTTESNGSWTVPITIPSSSSPGANILHIEEVGTTLSAYTYFTVE